MSELDIDTSELMEQLYPETPPPPVRIEVGAAPTEVTESLVASMTVLAERLEKAEERQQLISEIMERMVEMMNGDRATLVAALAEMSEAMRNQPDIHVAAPIIPELQTPPVYVTVEAPPPRKKTVTVERDPLTGLVSSADVEEV